MSSLITTTFVAPKQTSLSDELFRFMGGTVEVRNASQEILIAGRIVGFEAEALLPNSTRGVRLGVEEAGPLTSGGSYGTERLRPFIEIELIPHLNVLSTSLDGSAILTNVITGHLFKFTPVDPATLPDRTVL